MTSSIRKPPIRLTQSLALVGSSSECKVRLSHSDVSKAHCALLKSPEGGVWVVDLLGRGGTFVNETHVRFARLDDGDELRIGRHVLRFEIDGSKPRVTRVSLSTPNLPSRAAYRRPEPDSVPARIDRHQAFSPPATPSSSVPVAASWQYPDYEVHRALGGAGANQVELVQALMQPLVQQFGLMQQQMFEQFHQAMMGMFQTFGAAYREQMADLREELDEVRRITQELQELQAQAQAQAQAPPPVPAVQPQAKAHPAPRPTAPPQAGSAPGPAPAPSVSRPAPQAQPFANGAGSAEARPRAAAPHAGEPPEPVRKQPPTKDEAGVHNLLFERISALQNERQSRWQKILSKLNKT